MSEPPFAASRIRLETGPGALDVASISLPPNSKRIGSSGEQEVLIRFPDQVNEPVFLREGGWQVEGGHRTLVLSDREGTAHARLRIDPGDEGLVFRLDVEAKSPIWMAEWRLHGLELDQIIVPALGGQVVDRTMPAGEHLTFKYPFWWNAQFAIGATDAECGLFLFTREISPSFRLLRIRKDDGGADRFTMGLGFEAKAPLVSNRLSAEWVLDGYQGDWRVPASRHQEWMRSAFGLMEYDRHPHMPSWANEIDLILEIWGMRHDRGRPAHTFAEMMDRLRLLAPIHPPERTLLYLPGFAENGIDSRAPSYEPAPQCGGREGFKRLVDFAHDLGYRVMIHTNVLALTYNHPRYASLKEYQVIDAFGRPQGWGLDMDGDWLAEPFFAYMNPGVDAWTKLMREILGELIATFGLDAVFLDQTLLAFNVSNGPDFVEGMRRHIEHLQAAFPGILFAGEGLHEQVVSALPMAQIHGLDSVTGVHGIEGRRPWREPHPVSKFLFGPFTRYVAHLLTAHPSMPAFAAQEEAYTKLDVVPALVLWDNTQRIDLPELRTMLERV